MFAKRKNINMKDALKKLESTLDTNTKGYSARKLSALFAIVVMGSVITWRYVDTSNAEGMLIIWLTFASFCLGMVTIQNIINLRNGTTTNNTSDSNELPSDKADSAL